MLSLNSQYLFIYLIIYLFS